MHCTIYIYTFSKINEWMNARTLLKQCFEGGWLEVKLWGWPQSYFGIDHGPQVSYWLFNCMGKAPFRDPDDESQSFQTLGKPFSRKHACWQLWRHQWLSSPMSWTHLWGRTFDSHLIHKEERLPLSFCWDHNINLYNPNYGTRFTELQLATK